MIRREQEEIVARRLDAMLGGYDANAPKRFVLYREMLEEWNSRMNLTGDTEFETVLDRHFMDSLAVLPIDGLFARDAALIDVGSGAGFPGLPLAIVRPDLQITLLDSLAKRIGFLTAVIRELGLEGHVQAVHARAEDAARMPSLREGFDIAVARAVAPLPVLCELLLPFVRVGGNMVCYKGPAAEEEKGAGDRASAILGGGGVELVPLALLDRPEWRHMAAIVRKQEKTPSQYPRRAGTPGRQPLGGSGA